MHRTKVKIKPSTRGALQRETIEPTLFGACATPSGRWNLLHLQFGSLDRRSFRHKLKAKRQSRRHDLAQMADLHPYLRNPPPIRLTAGDLHYRSGYGKLVQTRRLLKINFPPQPS